MYGPAMSGEIRSVAYYLERASSARIEAAKTTDREMADELLRLAHAFEILAERKKKQIADPAS